MTVVAGITAGDVVGRFSGRSRAIVTAGTGTQHSGVVEPGNNGEIAGIMAILATIEGAHM